MNYKKLMVLGGALLLAAGCSSPTTSPIKAVNGGGANTITKTMPKKLPTSATANSFEADTTGSCTYLVASGFMADSLCVRQDQ